MNYASSVTLQTGSAARESLGRGFSKAPAQESRLYSTRRHRFGDYERSRRKCTNAATPEPISATTVTKMSGQTTEGPPEVGSGLVVAVAPELAVGLAVALAVEDVVAVFRTVCPPEVKT